MNTKGTELSIFQGVGSIHVNGNQQRIEEEEVEQDKIRRHVELDKDLQDAFVDLGDIDDVDDTMESTTHSNANSYYNHSENKNNHQYSPHNPFSLRNGDTSLKNLLDSKTREIECISEKLTTERRQHKATVDEYEKRLKIEQSEKERALMTREQTHDLLVEQKGRAIEMEDVNEKLRSKIKSIETENSSLVGELESTKYMLTDIQSKFNMVERNVMSKADHNTDQILKQAQERHAGQIAMMQQQMDGLKSKFETLEHEHKNLEIRYKKLQSSREAMMIEKSETINILNQNLEDAQKQCAQLLARPNLSQDNRHLQSLVHSMESQKDEMNRTISKLQNRIKEQVTEMEAMDTIVKECGGNNFSFSETTNFIHRDPLKNVNSSTPMAPDARFARVKDELVKSLNNIKTKREEIKVMEKLLSEKDEEIKQLKSDENKALVQMNQYREEKFRLESKSRMLEKDLDSMRQQLLNKSADKFNSVTDEQYEEKLKVLQSQKTTLEEELNSIKTNYERLTMKNGELVENEKEWQEKICQLENQLSEVGESSAIVEDLRKEREKVQELETKLKTYEGKEFVNQSTQEGGDGDKSTRNTSNRCQQCDEYTTKLEKLELSCLQMQNANADNLTNLRNMKQELDEANQIIENLEGKFNLKELQDTEIEKLKRKAEEFEEFMKTNTRSGSAASNKSLSTTKSDVSTETSGLESDSSSKLRQAETKVRDEMAKIFAAEIKSMEKRFREEAELLHQRLVAIADALEEKSHELDVRNEQMQLLKFTILQEREEFERNLHQKDDDFKVAIEKYRNEFEENQQKVEELMGKLNEKKELIDEERLSIERLKRQITEERQTLAEREKECVNKLKRLREESTHAVKELTEKYQSAKKTAMNYKQFSEDKEKHYRSECERHKGIYAELVEKVEKRCRETLTDREKNFHEKIKKLQTEHEIKIEVYKGMLEKTK